MPRYPEYARSVCGIAGAVYSSLAHRLDEFEGEVYPLHVGDTWLEPAEGCRMQDLDVSQYPGMHRYAPPQGLPRLIDAVVERVRSRTGVAVERGNVLIAAGATGALGAVFGSLLDPGDDVLILAPYWPLITGIVRTFSGNPIEVPTIGAADDAETVIEQLEHHLTPRTTALYLSTPNNPTGRVLPRSWIEAMVVWAQRHDLWIVSDEVYEDYSYNGEHTYALPLAPERTFSAHSFSKAFGMAGNRCGYVIGPGSAIGQLCKVSTHAFYSTPTASQIAACHALDGRGDGWIERVRPQYRAMGDEAADLLGLPRPEGSTFLFVDLADCLDDQGLIGFLERCAETGLFLAPGPSFGPYPRHARLCFTSAAPAVVRRGVAHLARLMRG